MRGIRVSREGRCPTPGWMVRGAVRAEAIIFVNLRMRCVLKRGMGRLAVALVIGMLSMQALAAGPGSEVAAAKKGDRGVALADAPVPKPPVKPCVVTLFAHTLFEPQGNPTAMSAQPNRWAYTPPARCKGPWSKVVLEADFAVTAGRQYDRTASIWLDGVNLYFGTTQEPSADVAPHWHVERDLTRYASLFRHSGEGQVILNNWVNRVYTGVISGSARVLFYPEVKGTRPPAPADAVYGLDGDPRGVPVSLEKSNDTLARSLQFPRNVERAYLDIIAQSQATDEQWYMCIDNADLEPTRWFSLGPPASGDPLEQCGNGSFREVEVSIDGQPAGRAPVYPWTYTGGVDPELWRPIPDVQTLNFVPYQVDLTPFAARLDDGHPHTVAVRVIGAHHFFSVAANLLVYLDHGRKFLTGELTQNTLATNRARLEPYVQRQWKSMPHGQINGSVNTFEQAGYVIAGTLETSHGLVHTQVDQQMMFANRQSFRHLSAAAYDQTINMNIQVTDTVRVTRGGKVTTQVRRLHYPLLVEIDKQVKPDGSFRADITMRQGYGKRLDATRGESPVFWSMLDNAIASHDTADFNAAGTAITNSRNQHSRQTFRFSDSLGSCYARRLITRDGVVESVTSGMGCPGSANHFDWRSRPDAMRAAQ